MKSISTEISDLKIIQPDVFTDERGYFMETFNLKKYQAAGIKDDFVQDNVSLSKKGVLRGLHMQKEPYAQGKLVSVIKGAVLDVAVDARPYSQTLGRWLSVELTEENKKQFWIPPGFLHGFLSLKDETIFAYKCTGFYHQDSEKSVVWNDETLHIDWLLEKYGISRPLLSSKDEKAETFQKLIQEL